MVKVNEVAVIVPVFNEVEDILPDDTSDVAVIAPAAKPPLPSLLTIVFAVLDAVAELIAVAIVVDETPPTLFTVAAPLTSAVPLNAPLVYVTSPVVDMVLPIVNAFALDAVPLKVPVIVPVEKPPLLSLLTIVLGVLVDVAEFTAEATVVIVDELTPPTLFTVGASAEPPKSLVN